MCNRLNITLKHIHARNIQYVHVLIVEQNKAYFEKTALMFTQVAAIGARENNSGRYQCSSTVSTQVDAGQMRVEKVEQPNQPKTVFCQ